MIKCFLKFSEHSTRSNDPYKQATNEMRPWNKLLQERQVKIVMIHLSSYGAESPKDIVLGSVGITASFGYSFTFYQKGGDNYLYSIGKDILEEHYDLEKLNVGWKIKEVVDQSELGNRFKKKQVKDIIKENPFINQIEIIEICKKKTSKLYGD